MSALEREAFKLGYRFAAAFAGGDCVLCEVCEGIEDGVCRHPFEARPSAEAVGVDVDRHGAGGRPRRRDAGRRPRLVDRHAADRLAGASGRHDDGMSDSIVITGAREHNLKDISLSLPRDRFIVITGLSGSGKSSLAFDTIYAEGQRRYVESLSAYARQFLGQMDKPDVDSIEGLSPAISIDQKTTSRNPRSTVGTVTEIYDYLRLLYARVGHPHCPNCGRPIAGQSVQQIVDQVCELELGDALQRRRAAGARPQGRVRQDVRAAARRRLHPREGRRPGARARRAASTSTRSTSTTSPSSSTAW